MAVTRRLSSVAKTRFSGLEWAQEAPKYKLLIAGLGGIGSWAALAAARAGYPVALCDFDKVEPVNYAGQAYRVSDMGQFKVNAVQNLIYSMCINPVIANTSTNRIGDNTTFSQNLVLSCLDSMESRKFVYEAWKRSIATRSDSLPTMLVDGRLLSEQFQVYFVTKRDFAQYEATLFHDSEVEDDSCTNRQTSHYAMGIAFTMLKGLNNYMQNFATQSEDRIVPFLVEDEGFLFTQNVELCTASPILSS